MWQVRVGRTQPASSHRSSLTCVSSPLQKLVKSISQLKDQQDVFCFRYNIHKSGRKHTEGRRKTGAHWKAKGGRKQKGKAPVNSNHLWLPLTSYSTVLLPCKTRNARVLWRLGWGYG